MTVEKGGTCANVGKKNEIEGGHYQRKVILDKPRIGDKAQNLIYRALVFEP